VHVADLHAGTIELSPAAAHHARDVLRMKVGDAVELFDDGGAVAQGRIAQVRADKVVVEAGAVARATRGVEWAVFSAVPKGARADWMIEKLSELGTSLFVPLVTQRSVVVLGGKARAERWERIAREAARQSRRAGVMRIGEAMTIEQAVGRASGIGWYLSTEAGAMPMLAALGVVDGARAASCPRHGPQPDPLHTQGPHPDALPEYREREKGEMVRVFVGPEGGWTNRETQLMQTSGLTGVSLGPTILRVETAAVAAAAIVGATRGR
jgi:16S rRNA (uracil1498-N3)-methyltransferase